MLNRRNFLIITATSLLSSCTSYSFVSSTDPNQLSRAIILEKINQARKANGKKALAYNEKLELAAQNQANIMAKAGILSHELDGKLRQRVTIVGYQGAVGENLAGGQATLEEAIEGWLNSPAHRSALLSDNFNEFGLAFARSTKGKYSYYWAFIAGGDFSAWQ